MGGSTVPDSYRNTPLTPATTASSGEDVTRADYHRWLVEDRNYQQAQTVRSEREQRRRFKEAQQAQLKARGHELAVRQKKQMMKTAAKVEEHKAETRAMGVEVKVESKSLAEKRARQRGVWAKHGLKLAQQHSNSTARERRTSLANRKAAMVEAMKNRLTSLEKEVLENKEEQYAEKRKQVERVREETADEVTRAAKQLFIDERWDIADSMREDMEYWKAERKDRQQAYLESALSINAKNSPEPVRNARKAAYSERWSNSNRMRLERQQLKARHREIQEQETLHKIMLHDSIHKNKFSPAEEIKSITQTPEGTARLKPFFSFRMGASGHRVSPHEVRL